MKVTLLLFAVLRDVTGLNERGLELAEGATALEVWESLRSEFPRLANYVRPPMTAINETYASAETVLHDGDELAFIPPVAGGH